MIEDVVGKRIKCDHCGAILEWNDSTWFQPEGLDEIIEECGWEQAGDMHLCVDCAEVLDLLCMWLCP